MKLQPSRQCPMNWRMQLIQSPLSLTFPSFEWNFFLLLCLFIAKQKCTSHFCHPSPRVSFTPLFCLLGEVKFLLLLLPLPADITQSYPFHGHALKDVPALGCKVQRTIHGPVNSELESTFGWEVFPPFTHVTLCTPNDRWFVRHRLTKRQEEWDVKNLYINSGELSLSLLLFLFLSFSSPFAQTHGPSWDPESPHEPLHLSFSLLPDFYSISGEWVSERAGLIRPPPAAASTQGKREEESAISLRSENNCRGEK